MEVAMAKTGRVTDRERHACALVREARTMSGAQLLRLVSPGRTERAGRFVLKGLVDGGLLLKTEWVGREGVTAVYSVTVDGDRHAESVAPGGRSLDAVDVASMNHHLQLTELYVRLLEGSLPPSVRHQRGRGRPKGEPVYVRARHPRWRWAVGGEAVSLPWKEYAKGLLRERLIRPDAVLDVLEARRRLFIEEETGSHTVRAVSPDKPGATVEKLKRYVAYVTGFVDAAARTTWYQARYPDGFVPELVLLQPSDARCVTVRKAVEPFVRPPLKLSVWTLEQAVEALRAPLGLAASPAAPSDVPTGKHDAPMGPVLTAAEVAALTAFFASARADLKARQADAGAALKGLLARRPAMPASPEEQKAVGAAKALYERLRMPLVPEGYDAVRALVVRLGAVLS